MTRHSLFFRITLLCLLYFFASSALIAQTPSSNYPTRPIRMLIAYTPGGGTDIVGRLFAQELSLQLGQPVVVENRAGGGTLVATETLRKAPGDGYTLLFGTNAFVITPLLHDQPTYDPVTDFEPIGLATIQPLGLLLAPQTGLKSTEQLIAYAKEHPGKINFASSSNGSAQHLAGEAFRVAADIDITHIAYKGAGPALIDLLAGRVDMMFTSLVGNMDHVKDGRLTLLGVTGVQRSESLPNTPTVAEAGLAGFEAYTWQGLIAPAETPQAIVTQVNTALLRAAHSPKIIETLNAQGMTLRTSTPEQMRQLWITETKGYRGLLQRTKTTIQ